MKERFFVSGPWGSPKLRLLLKTDNYVEWNNNNNNTDLNVSPLCQECQCSKSPPVFPVGFCGWWKLLLGCAI